MDKLRQENDDFNTDTGTQALVYKKIGSAVKKKMEAKKHKRMNYNPNKVSDKLPLIIHNIPYFKLKKVPKKIY